MALRFLLVDDGADSGQAERHVFCRFCIMYRTYSPVMNSYMSHLQIKRQKMGLLHPHWTREDIYR